MQRTTRRGGAAAIIGRGAVGAEGRGRQAARKGGTRDGSARPLRRRGADHDSSRDGCAGGGSGRRASAVAGMGLGPGERTAEAAGGWRRRAAGLSGAPVGRRRRAGPVAAGRGAGAGGARGQQWRPPGHGCGRGGSGVPSTARLRAVDRGSTALSPPEPLPSPILPDRPTPPCSPATAARPLSDARLCVSVGVRCQQPWPLLHVALGAPPGRFTSYSSRYPPTAPSTEAPS
ncbi:hypothetical protein BS78_03G411700 [Paspalum vaginatum]|nr:hypothetical protein BS78_03G411700 [Paspalum vaginatum]